MTDTLLLNSSDVAALLALPTCLAAIADVLHRQVACGTVPPGVLGLQSAEGGIHVKGAGLLGLKPCLAVKLNANFPGYPQRFGLPTIQGGLVLFDGATGQPLAVLDSMMITGTRPGRAAKEEITVFDSTGTALQDLAAAIAVDRRARATGTGRLVDFGA